jgi:hypothetical protein
MFLIYLDFLESYYGSLKANPTKIHKSLVGCLRNDRGKQKRVRKQIQVLINDNNDDDEEINGIADDDEEINGIVDDNNDDKDDDLE